MAEAKVRVTVDLLVPDDEKVERFIRAYGEKYGIESKSGLFRVAVKEYMERREQENREKKRE